MAEIRPIKPNRIKIEKRLDDLERRGVLGRPADPSKSLKPVARREGALERFLADRAR